MARLHALDAGGQRQDRAAVDRDGGALAATIDAASATGAGAVSVGDDPLKPVPKSHAADKSHADLLKRKQIIMGRALADAEEELHR